MRFREEDAAKPVGSLWGDAGEVEVKGNMVTCTVLEVSLTISNKAMSASTGSSQYRQTQEANQTRPTFVFFTDNITKYDEAIISCLK